MLNLKGKIIGNKYEILEPIVPGPGATTFVAKEVGTGDCFFLRAFSKSFLTLTVTNIAFSDFDIGKQTNSPFLSKPVAGYQDGTYLYIVSEFLQGGDLFNYLQKGPISENDARFFAAQILLGIEELHKKRVIFRNLKPEVIYFDPKGNCKLTSYDFSKIIDSKTFTLCGTPDYLSPEIVSGSGATFSTDLWSYGALVYEMVAGKPPYYDQEVLRTYAKIMQNNYSFPETFSSELKDLIQKLLVQSSKRPKIDAIKAHPWFADVNWDSLAAGEVQSPFVPEISSKDDLRYFEVVKEEEEDDEYSEYGNPSSDDELFKNENFASF